MNLFVNNILNAVNRSKILEYKKSCKIEIDKNNYTCDIVDYIN